MEAKHAAIEADIKHFGMRMPEFRGFHTVRAKLSKELANWLFFIEYRKALEPMEAELWLSFRASVNSYSDLVNDFLAKAKGLTIDQVGRFVGEVLEEGRQGVPLLRCLTGENF